MLGVKRSGQTGDGTDVSVVVPVRSRFEVLDRCLDGLHAQSLAPERYEVIVVANGVEEDRTAAMQEVLGSWSGPFDGRLRVLHLEEASIPRARNLGVRHAGGRVVLQINEDTVISRTALARHYAEHESRGFDPRTVLVGGRRFPESYRRNLLNYLYEAYRLYTPLHVPGKKGAGDHHWFVTCNLSCPRRAYELFGWFDEEFLWGSDTELGRRWAEAGSRILVDTDIVSYHLHELSFESFKVNCTKRVPYRFKMETGRWPEEATPAEVGQLRRIRRKLAEHRFDPDAFEEKMLRLEQAFTGPEDLASLSPAAACQPLVVEPEDPLVQMFSLYKNCIYVDELWRTACEGRSHGAAPALESLRREEA